MRRIGRNPGWRALALGGWLLAVPLLACGSGEPGPPEPAPPVVEPAPDPAPPEPAPPTPAPPEPSGPDEPEQPLAGGDGPVYACIDGDWAEGEIRYALYCTTCHGVRGDGQGPSAAGLNPKPALHNDGTTMNTLTNEYLFEVISKGGAAVGKSPLMAAWGGVLSDAQIHGVVAYIRSLAEPAYSCP